MSTLETPARVVEARLRVIYGDTDQMGVVYYANYLRYFELSRSEYFRACGGSYRDLEGEHSTTYTIDVNSLASEETEAEECE